MSPPSVTWIFSGNSSLLRNAYKRFVLCMHIIRLTQIFHLTKNSKSLTFFVSSKCELKPQFPKAHCFWRSFQATTTCPGTQITTCMWLARHTEVTFPAIYFIQNAPTESSRLQITPSWPFVAPQSLFPDVHISFTGRKVHHGMCAATYRLR